MPRNERSKKPAGKTDWHNADIVCALHKQRLTLRKLSLLHGYTPKVLGQALHSPYPRAERLIAAAIGVAPQAIWPSRYTVDGAPRSGRGERQRRGQGRHLGAYRAPPADGNVQPRGAD
ncbi:MAG: helix-turn-helix domain-containing protein [Burkholderiales bacterium]|nr:helix-turn-helix domain-containing protein [Burkholderiales bacterium]